ncbi:tail fiber domain-containing protein [Allomuricauda taeanensis]|uniref:tail fiber domain-containing protein n=1 Tax=Flagellimonas taeanensis TaxID=1005926 RepID=UPI002E7BA54B|nr:tail fiber domain-containing protein [Allomuricauda taeanensis]MEE1963555.1 tail fiber domain-containing protein [Allomuricauda taeanensis]
MAIVINTVSDTKFSLNGTTYGKIYQPLAQGTEHLSIVNVYDTKQKLLNSTHFTEFTVNGSTFLSQDTLISALILVIFSIGEGGGGGGGSWGEITGTLSDQGDLQSALDGKASTSHSHTFASITGKPTTLSGYGITNAYTKTESDGRYLQDETYGTPSELLTAIKTVDGTGSSLDADLLGGVANTSYARTDIAEQFDGSVTVGDGSAFGQLYLNGNVAGGSPHRIRYNGNQEFRIRDDVAGVDRIGISAAGVVSINGAIAWHSSNDGAGSGLDADLLDGFNSSTSGTANTVAVRNGSGQLYATAFFESSDRSLKENIEYLTPDFVKFNFKDSPDQLRYGVIAQEVEKKNPELVHTDETGLKSVNYLDLLVLRFVEMNRSMENLIKELETLKSQING